MRILVLATKPLELKSGDALRFVNVARHLKDRHAFELFCFARPGQELDAASAAVFERVTALPFPPAAPKSLAALLSPAHFMPSSPDTRAAVARAMAEGVDGLVFDLGGLMLANLPPGELRVSIVVDSIDEPRVTYQRALRHGPWREKPAALR